MAGRSIGSALRGEKKGFNALLRPGQSRTSPAHREDDGDPIEEMGEIERTARTLKLPQNPVDVRSKPEPATVEALRGGRNGERKKVGVGRITPTGLSDAEDWNRSTFCPAQFHPKSVADRVQKNLHKFYQSTNALIGGRAGKPLDPGGYFQDAENDRTVEFAASLYKDAVCYPRW